MADLSDEELMNRFCGGDEGAFDSLFSRYAGRVQAYLVPMVRDPALAEDLMQTTFLSVIRSRDRYTRGASVAAWLFSIAANAARDTLRRRRRGLEQLSSTGQEGADAPVHDTQGDPGLRRALEQAFAQLPEAHREAVILHKVEGLDFEQVGQVLGVSSTAARIRAHRGYERLRLLLARAEVTP
jgi:RNA polymerase sigma factor (sigma-70 family)